jgi:hypothetical protein
MPTLYSHTHCQVEPADTQTKTWQRVRLFYRTDGQRKKTTKAQYCIRAIAGEVVKSRSVHLINFSGGGQVIALKSATALILDRYGQW